MEPVSVTLVTFSAVLSIAASVTQIASNLKIPRAEALQRFEETASVDDRNILTDPEVRVTVLALTVISGDLLEQLSDEIEEAEKDYIEERKKASTIGEKDSARNKAAQIICSALRDIAGHNGGSLPPDDKLSNWFSSYNCQA